MGMMKLAAVERTKRLAGGIWRGTRYALRGMRRRPGFAVLSIAALTVVVSTDLRHRSGVARGADAREPIPPRRLVTGVGGRDSEGDHGEQAGPDRLIVRVARVK